MVLQYIVAMKYQNKLSFFHISIRLKKPDAQPMEGPGTLRKGI
jgi:hypothetical protein